MSTEIYSKQSCQIKMIWQRLETMWLVIRFFSQVKNIVWPITGRIRNFSLVKKVVSVFPPFWAACQSGWKWMFATFAACRAEIMDGFKACRYRQFSRTIYRGSRKREYKEENSTECCFTQGISDAEERRKRYWTNSPKELNLTWADTCRNSSNVKRKPNFFWTGIAFFPEMNYFKVQFVSLSIFIFGILDVLTTLSVSK